MAHMQCTKGVIMTLKENLCSLFKPTLAAQLSHVSGCFVLLQSSHKRPVLAAPRSFSLAEQRELGACTCDPATGTTGAGREANPHGKLGETLANQSRLINFQL